MLKAEAVGVRFTFKHETLDYVVGRKRNPETGVTEDLYEARPVTRCFLQTLNPEKQFEGEAVTHPNDKFLKETGRKLSLARALKESGLGYEQRKEVWNVYFSR